MPSTVVTTVAWLALVLAAGALVAVVLLVRELRAMRRAHTDRKWEIQGLRAELVALRRDAAGASDGVPVRDEAGGPGGADLADVRRPSPSSPTAWRRRRGGRTPQRSPRRRPGG